MPARNLRDIRALIIDMDGVLYRGSTPLPGLHDFFGLLERLSVDFSLATNNSSRTPQDYVTKLAGMNVAVKPERIITSSTATALYLKGQAPSGAPVYLIGERGIQAALEEQGFRSVNDGAEYVVVGMDRHLSYQKLRKATLLIRDGAAFVGCNPDKTFPTEEGLVPGCGTILAALEAATDQPPLVIGKPRPTMFQLAMESMRAHRETTAVLGDRLETDILGGIDAGLATILVLSGVTRQDDLAGSGIRPRWIFEDLVDLVPAWREDLE